MLLHAVRWLLGNWEGVTEAFVGGEVGTRRGLGQACTFLTSALTWPHPVGGSRWRVVDGGRERAPFCTERRGKVWWRGTLVGRQRPSRPVVVLADGACGGSAQGALSRRRGGTPTWLP